MRSRTRPPLLILARRARICDESHGACFLEGRGPKLAGFVQPGVGQPQRNVGAEHVVYTNYVIRCSHRNLSLDLPHLRLRKGRQVWPHTLQKAGPWFHRIFVAGAKDQKSGAPSRDAFWESHTKTVRICSTRAHAAPIICAAVRKIRKLDCALGPGLFSGMARHGMTLSRAAWKYGSAAWWTPSTAKARQGG